MMKYFILAFSVILIYASCSKSSTPTVSRQATLRTGRWKISSGSLTVKLPNGKDSSLNYMNFIPACHLDDYIDFNSPNYGAVFSGVTKCNPGDPDSVTFTYNLSDNDNELSINSNFYLYYGVSETIQPFVFDTLQNSPAPLVLDTLYGVLDTAAGYTRTVIVLDTIWNLQFTDTPITTNSVFQGQLSNFSASSFTFSYRIPSTYPDSLNHHTNLLIVAGPPVDSIDANPIIVPDSAIYTITYTNF